MKYVLILLLLTACSSAPVDDSIPYCPAQRVSKEVVVTTYRLDRMNILREHTITYLTCVEKQ
jgi:hypothetical protein